MLTHNRSKSIERVETEQLTQMCQLTLTVSGGGGNGRAGGDTRTVEVNRPQPFRGPKVEGDSPQAIREPQARDKAAESCWRVEVSVTLKTGPTLAWCRGIALGLCSRWVGRIRLPQTQTQFQRYL